MQRSTLWTWIGAAVIGVGLVGVANADPWDRDRDHGASRMQELRQSLASRDQVSRPNLDRGVTGHQIGHDTLERDSWKREFRDRNDMMSHMSEHTKMRAERTVAARGENSDTASDRSFPNAGRNLSRPTEVMAKAAQPKAAPVVAEPGDAMTAHEEEMEGKSVAGRTLGQDTMHIGDANREFKNREDMLAHLNTQTAMRASKTEAAQGGEDAGSNRAYPNAGRTTSDPTKLTDKAREGLKRLGFSGAGKRQSSADIEDKAR